LCVFTCIYENFKQNTIRIKSQLKFKKTTILNSEKNLDKGKHRYFKAMSCFVSEIPMRRASSQPKTYPGAIKTFSLICGPGQIEMPPNNFCSEILNGFEDIVYDG